MVQKHSTYYGIAISPGIGFGKACIWGTAPSSKRSRIRVSNIPRELERFAKAVEESLRQAKEIQSKVAQNLGAKEADIFEAHVLLLKDPVLRAQIEKIIVEQRINAEIAVEKVINESIKIYSSVEDTYLKERIQDIRDVGRRVLDNLAGFNQNRLLSGDTEIVVVAEELTPSQLIDLDHHSIKGFVTEKGGETSHSAILARSLGIPLISGIPDVLKKIQSGTQILVNGFNGIIIRNPTNQEIKSVRQQFPKITIPEYELEKLNALPTETKDGKKVNLMANVRSQHDIDFAKQFNADGIGLYRTEMAFINRKAFPSEEEQFEIYSKVVETMAPAPVTIRTLDLGGDKFSQYYPLRKNRESNPYLGLRAIRISLTKPDIFKSQLRAITRASAYGNVKLLVPMISRLEEIRQTKRLLYKVKNELRREKIPFDEKMKIGAMIEIPSAVIIIKSLLREVDFISVGTNDLIQYTLAVDRSNEMVSYYYEPLHPAVINSLKQIADAAKHVKKEVSICGEMAADPRYTKLLLGLGYDVLSMSSLFIPQVKKNIRTVDMKSARELANHVCNLWEIKKIKKFLARNSNHR